MWDWDKSKTINDGDEKIQSHEVTIKTTDPKVIDIIKAGGIPSKTQSDNKNDIIKTEKLKDEEKESFKEYTETIKTDENGFYKFEYLIPGEYTITVSAPDGAETTFDDKESTVVADKEDKNNDWGFYKEKDKPSNPSEEPSPEPSKPSEEPSPEPSEPSEETSPEPSKPSERPSPKETPVDDKKEKATPEKPIDNPQVEKNTAQPEKSNDKAPSPQPNENPVAPAPRNNPAPVHVINSAQSQPVHRANPVPVAQQPAPAQPVYVSKKVGPAVHTGGQVETQSFIQRIIEFLK